MNELEVNQPEESLESTESTERVEDQALDDATHEPGARVEESQSIEQAETVEDTLVTAMDDLKVERTEEDGSIDRDEYGTADGSEISEGSGKDDEGGEEATPINLPGPVAASAEGVAGGVPVPLPQPAEDGSEVMLDHPGTGGHVAEDPDPGTDPPGPNVELSPDDVKSDVALDHPGTGGNVAQDPVPEPDPKGQMAEEPQPGPDPFPQPAESPDPGGDPPPPIVELSPDDVKDGVALDHTGPGGNVAAEDDWESPNVNVAIEDDGEGGRQMEAPEIGSQVELDHTGPGGNVALDHPGTGGNVALDEDDYGGGGKVAIDDDDYGGGGRVVIEEDDYGGGGKVAIEDDDYGEGAMVAEEPEPGPDPFLRPGMGEAPEPGPDPFPQTAESPDPGGDPPGPNVELSPDDVKKGESLQPAPDFEAMSETEQSVVEIIGKAIADDEYRTTLFEDARSAIAGYSVTDEDQTALGEMTKESFDFFAAEVEKRFSEAIGGVPEGTQQKLMQQVVHAVWRDLNPGGLAYILAHKIHQKHLA